MIKCPICGKKVELLDSDKTVDCEVCGYHYLEICPNCKSEFNIYGGNVEVFDGNEWHFFSDEEVYLC
ncbi:MAG: hypothetical protein ACFFG0_02845 [Candidatus Thorarchaeota archaeon]